MATACVAGTRDTDRSRGIPPGGRSGPRRRALSQPLCPHRRGRRKASTAGTRRKVPIAGKAAECWCAIKPGSIC
ncbi:MAG: hypothetical protein D6725_07795, partial [Planctomycetota bacterium]